MTTEPELVSVTHTQPPPTTMPPGVPPIAIAAEGWKVCWSMLCNVLSVEFTTQAASSPNAMDDGPWPTAIVWPPLVRSAGLSHETVPAPLLATQTPPPPTATPVGSDPAGP